jgi:Gnt-I system low-affinity gluconate transporter
MSNTGLVSAALAGIALVVFLVVKLRLHAFLALLIGSLAIGVLTGMPAGRIIESVAAGAGSTLAAIAVIVGLGAMLGRILEVSGGMSAFATALIQRAGERHAQWSMLLVGFVVAIPVFFDVAFIVLISLAFALCRRTGRPLVYFALPLLAGIAVAHAFIPPTPGPIAVAGLLGADLGWVMLFGTLVGLPAAALAGPVFARYAAARITGGVPDYMEATAAEQGLARQHAPPGVWTVLGLVALPLALIVVGTLANQLLAPEDTARTWLAFIGHPILALLIATVLAYWLLGIRAGYPSAELEQIATRALEPAGIVILVTAAGGILKQVLIDSGVGDVFAQWLGASGFSPFALAFATAACIRLIQGSATVAMLTAGGLVAPLLVSLNLSAPMLGLLVIAISAGATIASHVNDSGFWLVNRYLGLSVAETLKTWTLVSTLIALVSFVLILVLAALIA